jgi:DNA topoisomerase-2
MKHFLDTEVLCYGTYKVVQQLPNAISGLSQTQTKILHVLQKKPDKKVKTAEVFTMIYNDTKYRHGDVSANTTTSNLAAQYSNNINLLKPSGTFGFRSAKKASSARYTNVIFGKIAQAIFNKKDIPLLEEQILEETKVEPHYLLPIIPIGVINGMDGIGMGYSCKVYPRDPIVVVDLIIDILTSKSTSIPGIIPVHFPFFNGEIENGENPRQFIIKGRISKIKKNVLKIEEVPVSLDREKIIENLDKLKDKDTIKSFTENCVKNKFDFTVRVPEETFNKSEDELLDLFSLTNTISDSITLVNRKNGKYELLSFNNVSEYLGFWIKERLRIYRYRLDNQILEAEANIRKNQEQIRFIKLVQDETILINKQSKAKIIDCIIKNNFDNLDPEGNESGYNYLVNMPIYNLSSEKLKELEDEVLGLQNDLEELRRLKPNIVWAKELKDLRKLMVKDYESKIVG